MESCIALLLAGLVAADAEGDVPADSSRLQSRLLQSGSADTLHQVCHADMMIENLDFGALSTADKAMLGPKVAETIAVENGVDTMDVMSLDVHRGTVDFFPGSQSVRWATIGWFTESKKSGQKTAMVSLVDQCDTPQMMLHIFENPKVHDAVLNTVAETLEAGSEAIVGQLKVVCSNVVRGTVPTSTASPGSMPREKEVLFPPWKTQDMVAAAWGWFFIFVMCACPLMVLRCLWLCCCKGLCRRKGDRGEFLELSELEEDEFTGH